MQVIEKITAMQDLAESSRQAGKKIGVVPTMGYLHAGHLSLIQQARTLSDVVITTIFVNPTQFAPGEDFARYPRDFPRDEKLAAEAGTDVIFYPQVQEMYPTPYLTYVEVEEISRVLCGVSRPTHFRGVTTVVAKLFHITKPHVAIFGQKDAQQALLIQRMVRDLNFDIQIVVAPIVREPDGLAMSSRNIYLTPEERSQAMILYQALTQARQLIERGERRTDILIAAIRVQITTMTLALIDYIEIVDTEKLLPLTDIKGQVLIALAVKFGKTRLIDNVIIEV